MACNWQGVAGELSSFEGIEGLGALAQDTLHGSLWALNHRYKTLQEAMEEDGLKILQHSRKRVAQLLLDSNVTFRRRRIPRCRVGLGTYGWKYDHELIKRAVEKGVCLIDTAEGYGYGKVETELGKALQGCPPVEVVTKVRRDHMSTRAIWNAAKRSKEKLGRTPHMQLHYPNVDHPNAVEDLIALRRERVIKSIGLGNCSVDMVEQAQRVLSTVSGDVVRSVQVRFNVLDQRIKGALLPYCQARGILVLAYSPLGQNFKKVQCPTLAAIARKHNATQVQVALAWILGHPGVVPIPRANSISHLEENLESSSLLLDESDNREIEELRIT